MGTPPRTIDLDALIRAHPFIAIERPPELWQTDADDALFIRFFGEMIAASLVRNGGNLAAVTISFNNLVIELPAADPMPAGEFVAVTAHGPGDWGGDQSRRPRSDAHPSIVSRDFESAAATAGAQWAYSRDLGKGGGSVTVLFRRRQD